MNKMIMIGLATAAMALTACGVPKHFNEEYSKYDPSMSKAMNLALLTGLTTKEGPLKDSQPVKVAKVTKSTSDPLKTINTASSVAVIAAQSTGAMLDAGMGIGGSMGAGALGLLTGGVSIYQPALQNHVFGWMPTNFTDNETTAIHKMATLLYASIKNTLPKGVKYIHDYPPHTSRLFSDSEAIEMTIEFEGHKYAIEGGVGEPDLTEKSWLTHEEEAYYWSYMKTSRDTSPTMGFNIYRTDDGEKPFLSEDGEMNSLSILKKAAAKLPAWVYLYIAPNMKEKTPAYFLNQGKVLPFISPSIN